MIVASVPKSSRTVAVQDTEETEADSEASTAGEGETEGSTGASGASQAAGEYGVAIHQLGHLRQNDMPVGQTMALDIGTRSLPGALCNVPRSALSH